MSEPAYQNPLGDRFHTVNSLALQHWLGVLSDSKSGQILVNRALVRAYGIMWNKVFSFLLRREERTQQVITPMEPLVGEDNATVTMPILGLGNPELDRQIVVVNVLSAGMKPADLFRDLLLEVHTEACVHMDHIGAERKIDADGNITHTEVGSHKSCKITKGAIFLAPDPMGATGSSAVARLNPYGDLEAESGNVFSLFVFIHAIVTPDYLRRIAEFGDERVHVFTGRVDRGLTANGYIYPGAGGIGERSNRRPTGD